MIAGNNLPALAYKPEAHKPETDASGLTADAS